MTLDEFKQLGSEQERLRSLRKLSVTDQVAYLEALDPVVALLLGYPSVRAILSTAAIKSEATGDVHGRTLH